jgi:GT2 family glycosyltransferase
MTSHTPPVAVLILNWNGRELLSRCLPSLAELDYPDYRVIVADNGSTDDSVAFVRERYPAATVIELGENFGFSKGYNEAVRRARLSADVLVLLNNDVIPEPDWLGHLVAPFADAGIGITGGKLYFADGRTIQHAGAELSYPTAYSHHYFYREVDQGQADEPRDVPYVTGAALAIRGALVGELGLFDEAFAPFYFEEADLCSRVRAAGYRVRYVPEARAIHLEGSSFEKSRAGRQFYFQRNRLRYVLKHYSTPQFLEDFCPAEMQRLRETPASAEDLTIVRRAYLEAMLYLPHLDATSGQAEDVPALQAALERLLLANLEVEPIMRPSPPDEALQDKLGELKQIREHEFRSGKAVIGPAVAAFRRAWGSVAARWYAQSILDQQNRVNEEVSRLLAEHARLLEDREDQLKASALETIALAKELAAMNQRLSALAARLEAPGEPAVQSSEQSQADDERTQGGKHR